MTVQLGILDLEVGMTEVNISTAQEVPHFSSIWPSLERITFTSIPRQRSFTEPHSRMTLKVFWVL